MKKLVYFAMVTLAFTVLQVATVGAVDMPPMGDHSGMTGEHPPGEHSSDMEGFRDCREIRPKGDLELMREAKNCFTDLASSLR